MNVICEAIKTYPTRYVVLTGGEPMIARNIHDLAARLREANYHLTIETAGTVAPDDIACDLASLSPKFGNSTPLEGSIDPAWIARHEATRQRPALLKEWIRRYPHQIKLVVATEADAVEALAMLKSEVPELAKSKIHLMPEGTDEATLAGRAGWLVDFCKRSGCRYGPRLHIQLFGNTRGT